MRSQFAAVALLGTIAFALSGCASMNKHECRAADWRVIGYEDGVAGYTGDRIGQYRKACARHGVSPDLERYQLGRREGLREFCQPVNGFRLGARGGSYGGVCPLDLDEDFVAAYESGLQLHVLRSRVSQTSRQLETRRRELVAVEDQMLRNSLLVLDAESTPEERAEALLDTRHLAERAGRLKQEIQQLEKDLVIYEQDLDNYRATVAFSG
jgi:hypothetical protein